MAKQTSPIKIALLSDIHGNLPALKAVIKDAQRQGVKVFWQLGDILGAGPFVKPLLKYLKENASENVIGNYDLKVLAFEEKKGEFKKTKKPEKYRVFESISDSLSAEDKTFLGSMPSQKAVRLWGMNFLLTHAGPDSVEEVIDFETPGSRLMELAGHGKSDVILFGHTHRQFYKVVDDVAFVNPGSVGRPEGDDMRASFAIMEMSNDLFLVSFHKVSYDIGGYVRQAGKELIAPEFLAGKPDGTSNKAIRSAMEFAQRCHYDRQHSEKTMQLAEMLFERFKPVHGYGQKEKTLLSCAGILHDIGWQEGQKAHHKKAMRMILEETSLALDERNKKLVANIARYHRKSLPKQSHTEYATLSLADQAIASVMGGLLRLADGLDRSHTSSILNIHVKYGPGLAVMVCDRKGFAEDELYWGKKKSDLLSYALKMEIELC